jgi:hypothetical protein
MNNNTFLLRVGLNPDNFQNILCEPITTNDGLIYDVIERTRRICSCCNCEEAIIKSHYLKTVKISDNSNINEIIRLKRVQFSAKIVIRHLQIS